MTVSPKDPRDAESVVEDEGVVSGVVPCSAHLHDAELALHPEFALPGESQVQDPVRKVIFFVLRVRRAPGIRSSDSVGWQLSEEEGRALEVPEPPNQGEHLLSRLLELREDLERVKGVEDEKPVVERLSDALCVQLEQVHPRLLALSRHFLAERSQVEDAQLPVDFVEPISEPLCMVEEARTALLEGDIQALRAVRRVGVQDMVRQRCLHRARCPRDKDDAPFRDAAPKDLVEAFDLGPDSLHTRSST